MFGPHAGSEAMMKQNGNNAGRGSYLILSGHDYRSRRKANMHFIAEELRRRGQVRFFSLGFSQLSRVKADPRLSLWQRANAVERHEGVDCYLWRTALHPVNLHARWLYLLEQLAFNAYLSAVPRLLRQWIREADTIVLESGMAIVLFDLIRAENPAARIIYICSDRLDTIAVSPFVRERLRRRQVMLDGIRVPSVAMLDEFPGNSRVFFVPHGTTGQPERPFVNPYTAPTNVVSVGSMLFDPGVFTVAAQAFPEVHFHVIGGGKRALSLSGANITVYDEMPYDQTQDYLAFADAGVAPYRGDGVTPYLADTSMKLMQFAQWGLPAICPHAAVGGKRGRYGYDPADAGSIRAAVGQALASGRFEPWSGLSWEGVTDRILDPHAYPDTTIPSAGHMAAAAHALA